jgi:hypothetical protein
LSEDHDFEPATLPQPVALSGPSMSRAARLFLGVLTFWPPVYIVLFILFAFGSVFLSTLGPSSNGGIPIAFSALFAVHLLTMLEMFGLTLYYAVNVYRDDALQGDRKILWMVIVLLGGFIGQAIYYVLWIVKHSPSVLGSAQCATPQYQPGSEASPRV